MSIVALSIILNVETKVAFHELDFDSQLTILKTLPAKEQMRLLSNLNSKDSYSLYTRLTDDEKIALIDIAPEATIRLYSRWEERVVTFSMPNFNNDEVAFR
jgi:Mg/Co/Ni transporter MgtE